MKGASVSIIDTWKEAGELGDAGLAVSTLALDVELVSPLTARFRFHGRSELAQLLEAVFEVVTNFQYVTDIRGDREAFLTSTAMVRDVEIQELMHLELDESGMISRITLAMRPLPAITAFTRAMGPVLARKQGSPASARTLALAGAFLDAIAQAGDARLIPLAAPANAR